MDLLSLCQADTSLRRVAATRGGEYAGPCPWCGGRDRFRVWPEAGRYWCRGCGRRGDVIDYLQERRGMTYREAALAVGKPVNRSVNQVGRVAPGPAKEKAEPPRPDLSLPGEQWQARAAELVDSAVHRLTCNIEAMACLQSRGLTVETIGRYRLGWWPADCYQGRAAWGLPAMIDHGKGKDLWVPAGVVIPYIREGRVIRLRIRRPTGNPRYYLLPGSYTGPAVYGSGGVVVVVESELDGLLLAQEAGDLVAVVALGSAVIRPDRPTADLLRRAALILVALDYDEAGGREAWHWWLRQWPQARRLPPIDGKDPGEMYQNGVDLVGWVEAGICEYLPDPEAVVRLPDRPKPLLPAPAADHNGEKTCYHCVHFRPLSGPNPREGIGYCQRLSRPRYGCSMACVRYSAD